MLSNADLFLGSCLIFFAFFGGFGNLNIIWATYRRKELQNKCGYLLSVLAFCDFTCLMFELYSAIRLLSGHASMSRVKCYWTQFPYITFCNVETYMIVVVSFDRQLAIQFPLKYHKWSLELYMFLLIAPGVCYGIFFEILSYLTLDDPIVDMCNLPSGMNDQISDIWAQLSSLLCALTVLMYVANFVILHKFGLLRFKNKNQLDYNKRIVNTLSINVTCFFVSAVGCNISILIIKHNDSSPELVDNVLKFAVIPGLVSYSANYYIYFWRSFDYKRAFKEQLFMISSVFGCKPMFLFVTNKKSSQTVTMTVATTQVFNTFKSVR